MAKNEIQKLCSYLHRVTDKVEKHVQTLRSQMEQGVISWDECEQLAEASNLAEWIGCQVHQVEGLAKEQRFSLGYLYRCKKSDPLETVKAGSDRGQVRVIKQNRVLTRTCPLSDPLSDRIKRIERIMAKNKENDERKAQIAEVNKHIRDGINQWADIMLTAEADQWAYDLKYFPRDLMNAVYIYQHVASCIGIHAGRINEEKAVEFGQRLRQLVIDMTGYDPHEFWKDPKNFETTN